MPKYYLSGSYTVKQEISFQTEIDADSAAQAAELFSEKAKTNHIWHDIEAPAGDYFDMQGSVNVYDSEEDRDDWGEPLIEDHWFEGNK